MVMNVIYLFLIYIYKIPTIAMLPHLAKNVDMFLHYTYIGNNILCSR